MPTPLTDTAVPPAVPPTAEILACACCGCALHDTPEENADHGDAPAPHDAGVGMCRACGGTGAPAPTGAAALAREPEADTRRRLGWAACAFVEARIPIVRDGLSETNRARFAAMNLAQQARIVLGLVEKGVII